MFEHFTKSRIITGIVLAAISASMWGISGAVMQYVSQQYTLSAIWFLSLRTLSSGIILLLISWFLYGSTIFQLFKSFKLIAWLLAYVIIGLMTNMLTFYWAIQTGNAAAATILQYLSPLVIVLGSLLFKHELPLRSDLIAFTLSLFGIFLALTKGDFTQLSIPKISLFWGIISGITAACYIVFPRPILKECPPLVVLGWGMFISGILFNFYHPLWSQPPHLSGKLILSLITIILIGTILPFIFLLYSLHFAPSDVVGIMDALQPITATFLSILFLGVPFSWIELLGSLLVILAIYLLQRGRKKLEDTPLNTNS
ncbi:EamA family transporter [Ligilactobacillus ceti]